MRIAPLILCVVAALGCKGKKDNKATGDTGSTAASASVSPGASATTPPAGGSVLALPKLSGTPPKKTTAPLDSAAAARMVALEFAGFKKDVHSEHPAGIDIRLQTEARPRLQVSILARPCNPCTPMELAAWQAKTEELKQGMHEILRKSPDTVFEVGQAELGGQPVISVYQLGIASEKDDNDNPVTAATNSYTLHYNDGVNSISVVAAYMDNLRTAAGMADLAPKEDLARMAKAFLDAYTHAW